MSRSPLFWKWLLILAVIGAAIYFAYPPTERINLGLDLRGGAHILMQVRTESAIEYQLDLVQDYLGNGLKEKGLVYASILPAGAAALEVRGTDPARSADVRAVLDLIVEGWEITSAGGGDWRLTMPPDQRTYHERAAIQVTLDTMRRRTDALGVAENLIQEQGIRGDRILVQLPGVEDPERIKDIIEKPGKLMWKVVTYPPAVQDPTNWMPPDSEALLVAQFGGSLPADTQIVPERRRSEIDGRTETTLYWPLKQVSVISGSDLKNSYRGSGEWGDPVVHFELTADAGRRFEAATRENVGRKMAIVLDDEVLSAPMIRSEIRDRGYIEGSFTVTSAEDLALKLKSGAFPVEVEIIEERTVGPSLGMESIRRSLWAGIVGLLAVLVFMVGYYRLAGVNAVVALGLNVVLVFGVLGALPFLSGNAALRATLTLPGIAGLILTVGMAVDANVLVFERIREELRLGKTVRSAVDQGFGRALVTIVDCNVTTIVAAVFLWMYGTGPVRGFAVTLIIGLAVSMFTAVFVSRQLFELLLSRKRPVESLSI